MPSIEHEIVVEQLTEPGVLAALLEATFGISLPELKVSDPNFSEIQPVERRLDGFFILGSQERPTGWILLEVQTSIDYEKLRTIPLAFEIASARFPDARGDVVLASANEQVANFFDGHPFETEGRLGTRRSLDIVRVDLSRLELGRLLDPRWPYLSILAVAVQRKGERADVAELALAMTENTPYWRRVLDAILTLLDENERRRIEERMQNREGYRSELLQKPYLEGKAEEARTLLKRILDRRGFAVPEGTAQRIQSEADITRLEQWIEAAISAPSLAAVFGDA